MNKGFTLIETLVTIFVLSTLIGIVAGLITMAYRSQGYSLQQSIAIDEARKGIKIMAKEIREARPGDDGSYPIEKAEDKEFIFYSDVDKDGDTERIRYFLGSVSSGSQTQECVTFADGGFCEVTFSNFASGTIESAQVIVSLEGDFGQTTEYAAILINGTDLGNACESGCSDCAGNWGGTSVFDITSFAAATSSIKFTADARPEVDNICDWINPNHSMKARFELSWTESLTAGEHEFKRGVINPTSPPIEYPSNQERIDIITSYVRNDPPIFKYFDANNQEITERPARLMDTKIMELNLIINVNPNRTPEEFELKSAVQLRNLKGN
jgi:prepilin-type N-terminal cleavage/methylation domain-containing protein